MPKRSPWNSHQIGLGIRNHQVCPSTGLISPVILQVLPITGQLLTKGLVAEGIALKIMQMQINRIHRSSAQFNAKQLKSSNINEANGNNKVKENRFKPIWSKIKSKMQTC